MAGRAAVPHGKEQDRPPFIDLAVQRLVDSPEHLLSARELKAAARKGR